MLRDIVTASSLCEVFWTDRGGQPYATGAVLLWWDDAPVLAFTFASVDRAYALAEAASVCVTLTESRSTAARFSPVAVHGRSQLIADSDGDVFTTQLLDQELRRYPPSRAYADSLLLQRENWWYLPRLLVRIEVEGVRPIDLRGESDDHVVTVATPDGLQPFVAALELDAARTSAAVAPSGGRTIPDGPAVALTQDASFPDLEQWSTRTLRGHTSHGRLLIGEHDQTGLDGVPSLWQRLVTRRRFGRACRRGIAAAECG